MFIMGGGNARWLARATTTAVAAATELQDGGRFFQLIGRHAPFFYRQVYFFEIERPSYLVN